VRDSDHQDPSSTIANVSGTGGVKSRSVSPSGHGFELSRDALDRFSFLATNGRALPAAVVAARAPLPRQSD
jgi:hypothetical protein